jgi:hypothetical protein
MRSLIFLLLVGCSVDNTGSVAQATQVSGSQVPPTASELHNMQSETVVSVQTVNGQQQPIVDVAYNDTTGEWAAGFVQYPPGSPTNHRVVLPGYSDIGYSISTNGGGSFAYQSVPKMRPPNYGQAGGWDALWGDPGIISSPVDQHFVFISSLAVSHQAMMQVGGTAVDEQVPIDGACIARSNDAGITFQPIQATGTRRLCS